MFGFIKKLFGSKPVEKAAPYEVEAPVAEVKKPTVKKATTRPAKIQGEKKPRKPKAPKA